MDNYYDRKKQDVIEFDAQEYRAPENSDANLADKFAAEHANKIRYVAEIGKWFVWNGQRWQPDKTTSVFDKVRKVCSRQANACNQAAMSKGLASAKTIAAVEKIAQSDRRLAATIDQWDADPFLLNTPDGTYDLRTGERRDHNANDYLTKMTAVSPAGDCPLFTAFLTRVTGSDSEYAAFLARVFGYSLTGSTKEHALFFLFGTGANGKSVLLNAITHAIGDYHKLAPIEAFTASLTDRHPTELAGLKGARLVTAVETEEGRKWAESRIKTITGGDPVTARFMRQDFFEYLPQFKLVIAGNHKPGLRSVDEAMRRRIHILPFDVTIPPSERDTDLPHKLAKEAGGILRWMLDGCAAYQRDGLKPPAKVSNATQEYFGAEDSIKQWIEECCREDFGKFTTVAKLYESYTKWAAASGVKPDGKKTFSQQLEARGYAYGRTSDGRGFHGLHPRFSS